MYHIIEQWDITDGVVTHSPIGYSSNESAVQSLNAQPNGLNDFKSYVENGGDPVVFINTNSSFTGSWACGNFIPDGLTEVF